jgi:aryl-alcohol dehydrogenase-like predicted oxidoreductase
MSFNKRQLGHSEISVSPLAFGGNVLGWTVDEPTAFKILDAFVAAGFNFIDTADVYSRWVPGNHGGESETILGNWFKKSGNRQKIILATKAGMEMGPDQKGLSKNYILIAVEDSLKRLQTDYIDLYQSHKDDLKTKPQETLEAFSILVKQGKVRIIGASNFNAERLTESVKASEKYSFPVYQTLQPLYNLYDRDDFEKNLKPVCEKYGISVLPFYSLASGFLTGKYRSEKDFETTLRGQRTLKYFTKRGLRILNALDDASEKLNESQATIAVAWLLAQKYVTAPIASATSLSQLVHLIKAVSLKLDQETLSSLSAASSSDSENFKTTCDGLLPP